MIVVNIQEDSLFLLVGLLNPRLVFDNLSLSLFQGDSNITPLFFFSSLSLFFIVVLLVVHFNPYPPTISFIPAHFHTTTTTTTLFHLSPLLIHRSTTARLPSPHLQTSTCLPYSSSSPLPNNTQSLTESIIIYHIHHPASTPSRLLIACFLRFPQSLPPFPLHVFGAFDFLHLSSTRSFNRT